MKGLPNKDLHLTKPRRQNGRGFAGEVRRWADERRRCPQL